MNRIALAFGFLSLVLFTVGCAGSMVDDQGDQVDELIQDEVKPARSIIEQGGAAVPTASIGIAAGDDVREPSPPAGRDHVAGIDSPRAGLVRPSLDVRGADVVDPIAARSAVVRDSLGDRAGELVVPDDADPRRGAPRGEEPDAESKDEDGDPRSGSVL